MRVGDLALWNATGKHNDVLVVIVKNVEDLNIQDRSEQVFSLYDYNVFTPVYLTAEDLTTVN